MMRSTVTALGFTSTPVRLLNAWTLFVKRNAVKGKSVVDSMSSIKAQYALLTSEQIAALKADAAIIPNQKRVVKRKTQRLPRELRKKHAPSEYNIFMKEQMVTLQGPVTERMKIVASRWKARQLAAAAPPPPPPPPPPSPQTELVK